MDLESHPAKERASKVRSTQLIPRLITRILSGQALGQQDWAAGERRGWYKNPTQGSIALHRVLEKEVVSMVRG